MKWVLLLLFGALWQLAPAQNAYMDSLYAYQQHYKKDLVKIIKDDTDRVRFFTPDSLYRVEASVELLSNESFFAMPTSSGSTKQARKFARLVFSLKGNTYVLYAYQLLTLLNSEEYKDDFFVPFLDGTSSVTTYEGGRYLEFKTGNIHDQTLIIDFNRAYNPYCAFTTGFNCPIPPRDNTLPLQINAGEKSFWK